MTKRGHRIKCGDHRHATIEEVKQCQGPSVAMKRAVQTAEAERKAREPYDKLMRQPPRRKG